MAPQRQRLEDCRCGGWSSFRGAGRRGRCRGVVRPQRCDALAVERIVSSGAGGRQQLVDASGKVAAGAATLTAQRATACSLGHAAGEQRPQAGATEAASGAAALVAACGAALRSAAGCWWSTTPGGLALLDYAPQRSNGTCGLPGQQASQPIPPGRSA